MRFGQALCPYRLCNNWDHSWNPSPRSPSTQQPNTKLLIPKIYSDIIPVQITCGLSHNLSFLWRDFGDNAIPTPLGMSSLPYPIVRCYSVKFLDFNSQIITPQMTLEALEAIQVLFFSGCRKEYLEKIAPYYIM